MEQKNDIFDHLKVNKVEGPGQQYFENLADQIIASQKMETKVIPLYKKPIVWITSAAAVLIAALLIFNPSAGEQENVLLALNEISTPEIQQYVQDNLDDFETDLLVEFVAEEKLTIESVLPVEEIITESDISVQENIELESIDEEEILKYLDEEEIDIYDLMEDESFI